MFTLLDVHRSMIIRYTNAFCCFHFKLHRLFRTRLLHIVIDIVTIHFIFQFIPLVAINVTDRINVKHKINVYKRECIDSI